MRFAHFDTAGPDLGKRLFVLLMGAGLIAIALIEGANSNFGRWVSLFEGLVGLWMVYVAFTDPPRQPPSVRLTGGEQNAEPGAAADRGRT